MDNHILVVDDEQDFLESVRRGLLISGFRNVRVENDPRRAATRLCEGEPVDVALLDVTMPAMCGVELLEVIKNMTPDTECIMVSAANEARVAVECLKKGAYDYLVKPVSREDLLVTVNHALEKKRLLEALLLAKQKTLPPLKDQKAFSRIITGSHAVLKVLKEAELHARSEVPVLITGESGTGKELLARAVHEVSLRSRQPFLPVNMASLTGTLFDAEFFGHAKGAFTGAERDRVGFLEAAQGGTLFLDEIGTLGLDLQGKLLRMLQEGEFIKVGTSKPQKADVRFITATNEDLESLIAKGRFRKDLYFRLRGAWLHLPPLRERKADIPLLINSFLTEFSGTASEAGLDEEALAVLMEYHYPGNIRELRSIVQSAINLAQGKPISPRFLPRELPRRKQTGTGMGEGGAGVAVAPLADVEKEHILRVYEQAGRNKARASLLLDIGINTLRRKLVVYGVK